MTEANSADNATHERSPPAAARCDVEPSSSTRRDVPSPLRVALVTTELGVGGAERCLVEIALGLSRDRFEPRVYSLAPPPSPPRDALVRRLNEASVPVRFLGLRRTWQFPRAVRQLARWFRDDRTQLVQSFLFHANVVAARARRRAGVPGLLAGWRVADPRRWRLAVERWAERSADRIVCVSDEVAEQARSAGLPGEKIVTIPNGVDLTRFEHATPVEWTAVGVPPRRKPLLCVGRLDPQKGLDRLLTLAPRLFEKLPEHDVVFVGDGPQRDELKRLASTLDIAGRVHFVGWRDDVPSCLRAAEIVLIPSRWEGMPNVLLEAMAAGRPVVANRVEGVESVLGPSLAELQAVPLGDDDAFIANVVTIATHPLLRERLGEENRRRVAEEYSLPRMIARYERLYAEVAGTR